MKADSKWLHSHWCRSASVRLLGCGFISHREHGCLSVVSVSGRGPCDGLIPPPGEPCRVWSRSPGPTRGYWAMKTKYTWSFTLRNFLCCSPFTFSVLRSNERPAWWTVGVLSWGKGAASLTLLSSEYFCLYLIILTHLLRSKCKGKM